MHQARRTPTRSRRAIRVAHSMNEPHGDDPSRRARDGRADLPVSAKRTQPHLRPPFLTRPPGPARHAMARALVYVARVRSS